MFPRDALRVCISCGQQFNATLSSTSPVGAVGQLLDSLEEIQMLAGANEEDIAFLQSFFEDHSLQGLLEVRHDTTECYISYHTLRGRYKRD